MASRDAAKLVIGLILAPIVAWLSTSKRGNRILVWAFSGALFVRGTMIALSERFVAKGRVGVMEGKPAVFVGTVFVGMSLCIALALLKPGDTTVSKSKR